MFDQKKRDAITAVVGGGAAAEYLINRAQAAVRLLLWLDDDGLPQREALRRAATVQAAATEFANKWAPFAVALALRNALRDRLVRWLPGDTLIDRRGEATNIVFTLDHMYDVAVAAGEIATSLRNNGRKTPRDRLFAARLARAWKEETKANPTLTRNKQD